MRLLIIEDQKDLANLMKQQLQAYGYACDIAYDGECGEEKGMVNEYDVILLDWNLPDQDGLTILQKWRASNIQTPVILVTARSECNYRVEGLEAGSDDYIVKPFEFAELHARIQAVLRRFRGRGNPTISIGSLQIDPKSRSVHLSNTCLNISTKEFDIIEYLAVQYPRIVSSEELMEHTYDEHMDPFSSVLRVHLAHIRKKLTLNNHSYLITKKGSGYTLWNDFTNIKD